MPYYSRKKRQVGWPLCKRASSWKGSRAVKQYATWIGVVALLVSAVPLGAQVTVGDNLSMNLNGQASAGYTADYGNLIPSDHGITLGGNVNLTGSYYDPNFFNFNVNPYYNQSRLNSSSASLSDASGVNTSANFFSGGKFPGSISYSKIYNSDGIFGVPGVANYTTNSNGDTFGVRWGVYEPSFPSLSVGYQQGTNDYSIYGQNGDGSSKFHSLTAQSSYLLAGFQLNAGYQHSSANSQFPDIFGGGVESSESSGNSFNFGVAHQLPWNGNISANYNRSSFDSSYGLASSTSGSSLYSATVDTISSTLYFHPIDHLSVGGNTTYTDNLLGSLFQTVIVAGGALENVITPGDQTHSLDTIGYATYQLSKHWQMFGSAEYRNQTSLGGNLLPGSNNLSSEIATATTTYTGEFKGGVISALVGLQQNTVSTTNGGNAVGLISSGNYSKDIGAWGISGGFNYSQDSQTVLVGYTTSNMGYSGNLARKIGVLRWSANLGGSKSLLNHTGYSTFAQNYSTSLSWKWLGASAGYTRSSGDALLSASGLVTTTIPAALLPSQLVFYGGTGWSAGLGANPFRRWSISATYSKAQSNTSSTLTPYSFNHTDQLVVTSQYQLRQLYLNAGYSRLVQGFSASTTPPTLLGSWYFGIQRWFNFF